MGVSGNLWIVVKDVKTLVGYDVEWGLPFPTLVDLPDPGMGHCTGWQIL